MLKFWSAAIALALTCALVGCGGPQDRLRPAPVGDVKPDLDPEAARRLVNAYRQEKGLKPLKLNADLAKAALAHSSDLARQDKIEHKGSDGSTPWKRVERTGYRPRLAAENVATGQISLDEVMADWKSSRSHNANLLLPDADEMGIALVWRPETSYKSFWTLVLGSKL
jgi:uncharacterized protein YkwD